MGHLNFTQRIIRERKCLIIQEELDSGQRCVAFEVNGTLGHINGTLFSCEDTCINT